MLAVLREAPGFDRLTDLALAHREARLARVTPARWKRSRVDRDHRSVKDEPAATDQFVKDLGTRPVVRDVLREDDIDQRTGELVVRDRLPAILLPDAVGVGHAPRIGDNRADDVRHGRDAAFAVVVFHRCLRGGEPSLAAAGCQRVNAKPPLKMRGGGEIRAADAAPGGVVGAGGWRVRRASARASMRVLLPLEDAQVARLPRSSAEAWAARR